MKEELIGQVSKHFGNISVTAIELTKGSLAVGDTVHIKGFTTDFTTQVASIQIEHESVTSAKKGQSIGLKVPEKTRKKDKVYKVIPD